MVGFKLGRFVIGLLGPFIVIAFVYHGGTLARADTSQSWETFDQTARQKLNEGDLEKAEENWQEALKEADSKQLIEPGMVNCLTGLALVYHKRGNFSESERLYELAMRNMEGLVGPNDPRFADWMPDLAWLYDQHGKSDRAEVLLKRVLKMREEHYGVADLKVADILDQYASFLRRHDRLTEAAALETRAKGIRDRATP